MGTYRKFSVIPVGGLAYLGNIDDLPEEVRKELIGRGSSSSARYRAAHNELLLARIRGMPVKKVSSDVNSGNHNEDGRVR